MKNTNANQGGKHFVPLRPPMIVFLLNKSDLRAWRLLKEAKLEAKRQSGYQGVPHVQLSGSFVFEFLWIDSSAGLSEQIKGSIDLSAWRTAEHALTKRKKKKKEVCRLVGYL